MLQVCGITSLGMDHMEMLGDTIEVWPESGIGEVWERMSEVRGCGRAGSGQV